MIRVNCRRCKNCTGEECKLYGDDPVKAAEYQRRYDAMKSCLMMASEYSGEAAADE